MYLPPNVDHRVLSLSLALALVGLACIIRLNLAHKISKIDNVSMVPYHTTAR